MNPPSAPPPPWLLPAILVVFPIVFAAIWSFVCLLLSAIGGWGNLAKRFAAVAPPAGQRFSGQTGRFGGANYNFVLTIHASPDGLHIAVMRLFRIGHPPLLIPWSEIRNATTSRLFISESVVFEVGAPSLAEVRLPKKVFAGQPVMIDGQMGSTLPPSLPNA